MPAEVTVVSWLLDSRDSQEMPKSSLSQPSLVGGLVPTGWAHVS